MSEPTDRASPPPPPLPPLLVFPVVSLLLPQPATTRDAIAMRKTAKRAVSRVVLIEYLRSRIDRRPRTYTGCPSPPRCSTFPIGSASYQTLATLSEVTGGRYGARATTQQTLWRPVRQHRRVDRQHAAGRAAAVLAEARRPHLRQAR